MKIVLIDIKICAISGCEHYGYYRQCRLETCPESTSKNNYPKWKQIGCPVPNYCPFYNVHLVNPRVLLVHSEIFCKACCDLKKCNF